jgi:hypothetical protein
MNEADNLERREENRAGVSIESEDINKWEMEVEPYLDRIYYRLIGYAENENGQWERNNDLPQLMNIRGANAFMNELRTRASINMQMSELDAKEIIDISTEAAESFINLAESKYVEFGLEPDGTVLEDIGLQLFHSLTILLNIAKDGGMKRHREARGVKQFLNPNTGGVY